MSFFEMLDLLKINLRDLKYHSFLKLLFYYTLILLFIKKDNLIYSE